MSAEDEVRAASTQFYAALGRLLNGDAGPMKDAWLQSETVTVMHPIGGRSLGWDAIGTSFENVSRVASDGKVGIEDQFIHIVGDVAYEVGVERGQVKLSGKHAAIDHRVTNIYRRDAGRWKLIHHHTDLSPTMLDALGRTPAS